MNKINILIAVALLLIAPISQAAEVVGKIGYMSGSLIAQRADGTAKIMGSKAEVHAGDVLSTAQEGGGVGLRAGYGELLSLRLDAARIINADTDPLQEVGDWRTHINLSVSF